MFIPSSPYASSEHAMLFSLATSDALEQAKRAATDTANERGGCAAETSEFAILKLCRTVLRQL